MGPDKLEYLLDYFVANRSGTDTVDGIPTDNPNLPDKSCCNEIFYAQGPSDSIPGFFTLPDQSTQFVHIGRRLADLANEFSLRQQNDSCVKFKKSCIIVPPEEHTISITLIRSDTLHDTVTKVAWKTVNKTAVSGTHYVASSGEIVFNKGVMEKTIQINILKTSDDTKDLRFNVEMCVLGEGFNLKIMTVSLKKIDNFSEKEREVVENLLCLSPFSVEGIRCILEHNLNCRTFHMALTHLCSTADSVNLEFALALDLGRLCLSKLHRSRVLEVLGDFFRMEDISM